MIILLGFPHLTLKNKNMWRGEKRLLRVITALAVVTLTWGHWGQTQGTGGVLALQHWGQKGWDVQNQGQGTKLCGAVWGLTGVKSSPVLIYGLDAEL